ncbi:MAG: hypothetical protein ACRCZS_18705 [Chroococcidiopsis sp.]
MKPVQTIEEAIERIEQYSGKVEDFELPVASNLLDDMGVAMAIVTDRVLLKGWMPNGYREEDSIRIFRYTEM